MKKSRAPIFILLIIIFFAVAIFSACVADTHPVNGKNGDFIITNEVLTRYLGKDSIVAVPDYVKVIGQSAFYEVNTLEKIIIPNSVTSIEYKAFYKCTQLAEATIPDSVTAIGEYAFAYTTITGVSIPKSVTAIGNWAFTGSIYLETITVDDDNPIYRSEANCLIERENKSIIQGCKTSEVPQSVERIGVGAFSEISSLESITIPDNIKYLGDGAFLGCTALTQFFIPRYVSYIGHSLFNGCSSLESISVASENQIFRSAGNCVMWITDNNSLIIGIKTSVIPHDVSKIDRAAFIGSSITSIEIPNCVTRIEPSAFESSELTEINISPSVNYIATGAFFDCNSLETIIVAPENAFYKSDGNCLIRVEDNALMLTTKQSIIPDYIKSIDSGAFGASATTNINIPALVTSISSGAFNNCNSIEQISVDSKNEVYRSEGNCIIKSNNELVVGIKTSIIPDSVTKIGYGAFWGNSELVSIEIPNSVTIIKDNAFFDCTALTEVIIPNSVKSIGTAFWGCSSLKSIKLSDQITNIGLWAFMDCTSLTNIEIPNSVQTIGKQAFYGCISLTNITMSNSVESIDESPFYGCISLLDIYFLGSQSEWNNINTPSVQIASSINIHFIDPLQD
jgi:hypothetical protein